MVPSQREWISQLGHMNYEINGLTKCLQIATRLLVLAFSNLRSSVFLKKIQPGSLKCHGDFSLFFYFPPLTIKTSVTLVFHG